MRPAPPVTVAKMSRYRAAASNWLRDPASAAFRNLYLLQSVDGDVRLCGALNARNGFGGYTGFRIFSVDFRGGDPGQAGHFLARLDDAAAVHRRCQPTASR